MNILLDTHLLIWVANSPRRLSAETRALLEDESNEIYFSAASIWEIAIKRSLRRTNFTVDPRLLRRGLLDQMYVELDIKAQHALELLSLPPLHRDPFDRLLIAQAAVEGITLLSADRLVTQYPGPIKQA
ncbi:type II toxin-antitoxin system VapC family toxin [Pseudoduganella sp. OTU4001]|uniref:type II toxin-antitoxin system VapC family toxin n=1 Tax=Pseudoduganella sp. OTU4001 TaxID=3043854 RepID=UPI00313D36D6